VSLRLVPNLSITPTHGLSFPTYLSHPRSVHLFYHIVHRLLHLPFLGLQQQAGPEVIKTHTYMNAINKFYTTWKSDGIRIFYASFIKLITNTLALCFFPPYATKSPTTLANTQAFFPLANPTNHNHTSYHKNCSNFFLPIKFFLVDPRSIQLFWDS
jgi:hypothetical protein